MNVYQEDINSYHINILCIYCLKLHNWLIHCKYWEKIYLIYDKHISRIKSNYLPFMNVYIVYTYIFTELYVIYYNIYFISIVNIRWINSFFTQKSTFLKILKIKKSQHENIYCIYVKNIESNIHSYFLNIHWYFLYNFFGKLFLVRIYQTKVPRI